MNNLFLITIYMIAFLESRGLLSTVNFAAPYVVDVIRYFYANLVLWFSDRTSNNCGKVYVRGKVFQFSATVFNELLDTEDVKQEALVGSIRTVVSTITNGQFLDWPHQLAASKLTNMYSVLHKLLIWNWMPTTNSNVVMRQQGMLLYSIGKGLPFNFGQLVFDQIASAAGKDISGKLHFPSLIFKVLLSQGLNIKSDDVYTALPRVNFINSSLVSTKKFNVLPWLDSRLPQSATTAVSTGAPSYQDDSIIPVPRSLLLMLSRVLTDRISQHQFTLNSLTSAHVQLSTILSSQKGRDGNDTAVVDRAITSTSIQGRYLLMLLKVEMPLKMLLQQFKELMMDSN